MASDSEEECDESLFFSILNENSEEDEGNIEEDDSEVLFQSTFEEFQVVDGESEEVDGAVSLDTPPNPNVQAIGGGGVPLQNAGQEEVLAVWQIFRAFFNEVHGNGSI